MARSPIKKIRGSYYALYDKTLDLERKLSILQQSIGRIEARQLENKAGDLAEHEFRISSQWGEDGIIDYLTNIVPINYPFFVEFGVEDYEESNTKFLLQSKNWSGLVIDSNEANVSKIKQSEYYWRHNLKAACAFINKDNINRLLVANGLTGEIGLLSIDIDGNDYWVWDAITVIDPAIVVIEFNSRLGAKKAITIPYDKNFDRFKAHYSGIYYGASLKALYLLGASKGYSFVGCNSAGVNAFFVKTALMPKQLTTKRLPKDFVRGKFRESRNILGSMEFLAAEQEEKLLNTMPFVAVNEKNKK